MKQPDEIAEAMNPTSSGAAEDYSERDESESTASVTDSMPPFQEERKIGKWTSKSNLTLEESEDGVDNPAFSDEVKLENDKDKPVDKPASEAVNLELINLVPYQNNGNRCYGIPVNGIGGIPVKKESETVDISTPYDEYFVPVNEHKKYMR